MNLIWAFDFLKARDSNGNIIEPKITSLAPVRCFLALLLMLLLIPWLKSLSLYVPCHFKLILGPGPPTMPTLYAKTWQNPRPCWLYTKANNYINQVANWFYLFRNDVAKTSCLL